MAKANPIPPFPSDLDRHAFGHWLSGFVDGEGSFLLLIAKPTARERTTQRAVFRITQRADDVAILRLVQSFLGCGRLIYCSNDRPYHTNSKPFNVLEVSRTTDLLASVVPNFLRYPLRAKKANDFPIWREGVELIDTVFRRPKLWRPGHRANRHGGTFPKWTDAELVEFRLLKDRLSTQRAYRERNADGD